MKSLSNSSISFISQIFIFLGILIIQTLPLYWNISFPKEFWIKQFLMYLIYVLLFFINKKILLPQFLFRSRIFLFLIAILILLFSVSMISNGFDSLLDLEAILQKRFHSPEKNNILGDIISNFSEIILSLLIIGSATVLGISKKLQMENQARQSLEQEKISSELLFLKAQINPHFFFNILNSIYALAKTDSPAREAIYNLSHLMRYVLYDTKNNLTSLSKEIAFVEDYIKLMELRITDQVQVIFEKPKVFKDIDVAPMLFLPFIENAYKHGISGLHPSYIYIEINQSDNFLQIEIRNSLFENQTTAKEESNGIGLVNTRRRLDLIYPGRYELSTIEDQLQKEYQVLLKIQTS